MPVVISTVVDAVYLLACTIYVSTGPLESQTSDLLVPHSRLYPDIQPVCQDTACYALAGCCEANKAVLADGIVMPLGLRSAANVSTLLQAPRASAARCSRLSCKS